MIDVKVNNISVTFKVDMHRCRGNGSLRKYPTDFGSAGGQHARQKLYGPNGVLLDLRGSFTVMLSQKQHKCDQDIFVNLLGLPAIKGLHLLSVLYNLECYPTTAIKQEFPSLFTGLGTLQGDYEI